jgi:hypothetical protein
MSTWWGSKASLGSDGRLASSERLARRGGAFRLLVAAMSEQTTSTAPLGLLPGGWGGMKRW